MIKILEKGQKTFTRTCDRCGCKFQYDLSDLSVVDHISCPCCNTTLTHIGPRAKKVGPNDTDLSTVTFTPQKDYQPYKIDVGDGGYNYMTTTGQYVNPNTVTTISDVNKPGSDGVTGKVDPNITIYANRLPDDVVDDKYNNVGSKLPDDIKDNCMFESDSFKEWYDQWVEEQQSKHAIPVKNKRPKQ